MVSSKPEYDKATNKKEEDQNRASKSVLGKQSVQ